MGSDRLYSACHHAEADDHPLPAVSTPIAADPPKEAVPLQILLFVSDRSPAIVSVAGLLGLAGLIIFISGRLVRRMEIDSPPNRVILKAKF